VQFQIALYHLGHQRAERTPAGQNVGAIQVRHGPAVQRVDTVQLTQWGLLLQPSGQCVGAVRDDR
jgi:hypothetical protein